MSVVSMPMASLAMIAVSMPSPVMTKGADLR
jgi:hypothetical protein